MTNKELQQHAKKYGMTVEQVKEARKHIKPALLYLKNKLQEGYDRFLCFLVEDYCRDNKIIYPASEYIKYRLQDCRPVDSRVDQSAWAFNYNGVDYDDYSRLRKLEWLKWQLKNVKP